ncbi:MAG: TIGR03619 family F420-dependent LLM class oxidoreductase [Alphaproteobacteria bacterium]|nr:TIGR03619 family F420-dependent LLM class oxidoreductase [Alphaproteobacteria bacterium]
MEVGIVLPGSAKTPPDLIIEAAKAVEERGFHAIWAPEHVVFFPEYESRYPYAEDGKLRGFDGGMIEPWTLLSFVAAHTKRVRLGSSVCLIPQRNPVYTAKQIADLDYLSGGRVDVGVGVGWLREEFEALQVPFERRGARTRDYLRVMQALWTEELASYEGEFYSLPPCTQNPKPAQNPHPPFIFGGESEPALRRVADFGGGWMGASLMPEDMPEKLARLDTLLEERGRTRKDIKLHVLPNQAPKADLFPRYEELGVEQVIHLVPLKHIDDVQSRLDRMAQMAFG